MITAPISGKPRPRRVLVVGAGIVGMSVALWLQRDGHDVTVVDRLGPGEGTSLGNAGGIVLSSCAPVGTPRALRSAPRDLLDPLSPLSVPLAGLPRVLPWLLRFAFACRPSEVERIAAALATLQARGGDAWRALLAHTGTRSLVEDVGWLKVYSGEASYQAAATERQLMRRHGLPYEVLDEDELHQLEPALGRQFRHAVLQPQSMAIRHPQRLVQGFAECFAADGGRLLREELRGVEMRDDGLRVTTEAAVHETQLMVVAAGPWSRQVCAMMAEPVSLGTERGYHLMLPTPERNLRRPTLWVEHGFVLCPMLHGLRITSGEELTTLDAPPDFRHIRRLLPVAERMLPGLSADVQSEWMGRRPSMPDSMPVLGRSRRHPSQVLLVFGHGHLGMTMGPVSGRIVADLVAGRDPGLDLAPFAPR